MSWNLTKRPSPGELAALLEETVHQRVIGTPVAAGVSVCGQTGVQCSTSTSGLGVTCEVCLAVVKVWVDKREARRLRKENSAKFKTARNARAHRRRIAADYVQLGCWLPKAKNEDLLLLVEAGYATSKRQLIRQVLEAFLDDHAVEVTRIRASRQVALQIAVEALQFAGKAPSAPKPSRYSTELKERLLAVKHRIAIEDLAAGFGGGGEDE